MNFDRRSFLTNAAGAAALAAAALPGVGRASTDDDLRIVGTVNDLRRQWSNQRQDYLDAMFSDRPSAATSDLAPHTRALGNGLGALNAFKELEQVPVEDQQHPAHQRLILDVAEGVGGMLVSCRELLERFLDGSDADPDRETHLRAALRSVRLSLSEWPTTGGRQRALEHSLLEVEREHEPGALLRRVRKQVARLKRAETLAEQLQARWEESGVLQVNDTAVVASVQAGQARWADVTARLQTSDDGGSGTYGLVTREQREKGYHKLVLGIIVLSVGIAVGAVVVLVAACALACGAGPGLIVVILGGLAVIGLSVWLGVSLMLKGRDLIKGRVTLLDDEFGPRLPTAVHPVAVVSEEEWVTTPARREGSGVLVVESVGLVRSPSGWMADPDGNGTIAGASALVPGAPVCALVGRVGTDMFYLGASGQVPPGVDGALELAINRDGGGNHRPKGHFIARVTVLELANVG